MQIAGTLIEDTHAEAFAMWASRVLVTAADDDWLDTAIRAATGYGTSIIGCDAEVGVEARRAPSDTPDGRTGAAILVFARRPDRLQLAVQNRVGQTLLTCPTVAVFDGLPQVGAEIEGQRLKMGAHVRYFGDGFEAEESWMDDDGRARRSWRIPTMEGDCTIEDAAGAIRAIGGGNFLIGGRDQEAALAAARRAVEAITPVPDVITPFPGGVVRSGSKVGSRYRKVIASTNDAFCPTLRQRTRSALHPEVMCVYEIVVDGLSEAAVREAMRLGIEAAAGEGIVTISAGHYDGKLGSTMISLRSLWGNR